MNKVLTHLKSEGYKYVLEIIVVISGILIAFYLERWNEERNSKWVEIKTLKEIRNGLSMDLRDITFNIWIHQRAIQSCEVLLKVLTQKIPYNDSLDFHFSRCHWYSMFIENSSPYEVLKTKGFEIISNDSLRLRVINTYDRDFNFVHKLEPIVERSVFRLIEFETPYFDKIEVYGEKIVDGRMKPLHFEKLREQEEYLFYLKSIISVNKFYLSAVYKGTEKGIKKLIQDIDSEIKRLDD